MAGVPVSVFRYFPQIVFEASFVGQGKCREQVKSFECIHGMLSTIGTRGDLADVWIVTF